MLAASTIEILAAGDTGTETMELQIDGQTVATFNNVGGDFNNAVYQSFSYTHPTAVNLNQIRVALTNDSAVVDRNLRVDGIRLDGVFAETEAPSTFSTGTWDPVGGCNAGNKQSEILHCDGYFQFAAAFNPGTLALGFTTASVNENAGTVSIPVVRTGGSDGTVSLQYSTVDGSATAGADFTATSGELFFAPGETSKSIVVSIINDIVPEGIEAFNVNADLVTGGATLGQPSTTTVSILDDEAPGGSLIVIEAAGLTGTEVMELQIDGAAVATYNNVGGDFTNSVFQTFQYQHTTAVSVDQIRVALTNDGGGVDRNLRVDALTLDGTRFETEASTTFSTGTWDPVGGCNAGNKQSEVLHCNGYFQFALPLSPGTLALGSTVASVNENAGTVSIPVVRTGGSDGTVSLQYSTVDGSATAGADFTATSGEVFFGPGETTKSIVVSIINDIVPEGIETFNVNADLVTGGATLGQPSTTTVSILDDEAPGGSFIVIEAAGQTGAETMTLAIDGAVVATFNNVGGDAGSRIFQTFQYQHTSTVTVEQIRVALTNDTATIDRNLRVDALTLDGVRFEAEAPSTLSTGTWDPVGGCGPGNKQSEFLHCNGYFQFSSTFNPGTLTLSTLNLVVNEQDGTVTLPVVRTNGSDGTVTMSYTTVDGSATAGFDYTATSGELVFLPGQTTASIVVPILDDIEVEGTESFLIDVPHGQTTGGATVTEPHTATVTIIDDEGPPSPGNGIGLLGEYYNNSNLTGFVLSRTDPTVNFDWDTGSPDPQIGADTFSARWTGQIEPLYTETYTFSVFTDDGVRLWVNNQLIIDQWVVQRGTHTGQIDLNVLERVDIRLEFFENAERAAQILQWSSPSQALEVIPQSQLYSSPPIVLGGSFLGQTMFTGLVKPTAMDIAPDGRIFVAEQQGVVRVAQNGQLLAQPFIDISAEVNNVQDRGLIGLALHPDFPNTPYVYLGYTYDPPETIGQTGLAGPDGTGNRVARVIRVTADANFGFNRAVPGSAVVLLGQNSTWANISFPNQDSTNDFSLPPSCGPGGTLVDCLPADSRSHTIGALEFGPDGLLYIANGDGTSFSGADPRTDRVQDINSLSGKLLRIDPITGEGLSSNPFFNGDPNANVSKVINYGLRNPFRFAFNPLTGQPYMGDVGWNTWEEINTGWGANFGWPYYEGGNGQNLQTGGYSDLQSAQDFYASNPNVTPPLWSRSHAEGAVAIVAGDFYTGNVYPAEVQNALFLTDFGDSIVRSLVLNPDGSFQQIFPVSNAIGPIVEMTMNSVDGYIYYVDFNGTIGRLVFSPNTAVTGGSGGGGSTGGSGAAAFGDFNSDGETDGADFLAWQRGLGTTSGAAITDGDADASGSVDALDLAIWAGNFGTGSTSTLAAATSSQVVVASSQAETGSAALSAEAVQAVEPNSGSAGSTPGVLALSTDKKVPAASGSDLAAIAQVYWTAIGENGVNRTALPSDSRIDAEPSIVNDQHEDRVVLLAESLFGPAFPAVQSLHEESSVETVEAIQPLADEAFAMLAEEDDQPWSTSF